MTTTSTTETFTDAELDAWEAAWDAKVAAEFVPLTDEEAAAYEADQASMCECEQDWNCGCGRYGGATWIETRYDGLDDERGDWGW